MALGSLEGPSYTGHVADTDSGLVYMQARYYEPQLGRFLSLLYATRGRSGDNSP
ncbi:RHS repeat-associated core domain-containing protein [Pinirhizobacter soli]|uniref:RHS repeat-associated core domain-containing protein n=1 Tax=Pinirhizobacter soli TaxID=2786953 RepID=UPI003CCE0B50